MKSKLFFIALLPFFFLSYKTFDTDYNENLREVRYFKSIIHNINRKNITLADNSQWRTNRFVIEANMTDVFFVLSSYSNFGDAFINGTKYHVSQIGYEEGFRYSDGYLNSLKTFHEKENIIELTDGSKWQVLNKGKVNLKKWLSTAEIVISWEKDVIINPYRIEAVKV